jgi:hypothetical protein
MPLEAEMALFESRRNEWLKEHEGRFVLIKGDEFSFFDSDEEAYRAGVDKWGNEPILIKQVLPEDMIEDSPALLYGLLNAPT